LSAPYYDPSILIYKGNSYNIRVKNNAWDPARVPSIVYLSFIEANIKYLTSLSSFLFVQGGIGPAGLSAEDLHVLDLTQQRPRWHR
jgi:hypothetical protein